MNEIIITGIDNKIYESHDFCTSTPYEGINKDITYRQYCKHCKIVYFIFCLRRYDWRLYC
jgi:hypothetical protein